MCHLDVCQSLNSWSLWWKYCFGLKCVLNGDSVCVLGTYTYIDPLISKNWPHICGRDLSTVEPSRSPCTSLPASSSLLYVILWAWFDQISDSAGGLVSAFTVNGQLFDRAGRGPSSQTELNSFYRSLFSSSVKLIRLSLVLVAVYLEEKVAATCKVQCSVKWATQWCSLDKSSRLRLV